MDGDLTLMASLNSQFFRMSPDMATLGRVKGKHSITNIHTQESRASIMAHKDLAHRSKRSSLGVSVYKHTVVKQ